MVGNIRGKFSGTPLFGGGSVNHTDLLAQGLAEKEKLETDLFEGASTGFGDAVITPFMVG